MTSFTVSVQVLRRTATGSLDWEEEEKVVAGEILLMMLQWPPVLAIVTHGDTQLNSHQHSFQPLCFEDNATLPPHP